jgi:GMP synthase-like glutamine amidotransferase
MKPVRVIGHSEDDARSPLVTQWHDEAFTLPRGAVRLAD